MPTRRLAGAVVSAGVDWLTCTFRQGPAARDFVGLAHELLNQRMGEGYKQRGGRMQGYKYTATDGLLIGWRPEDCMIQLTGELARLEWHRYAGLADNISRLDAQATVYLHEIDRRLAHNAIRQGLRSQRGRPGCPPEIGQIQSWEIRQTFLRRIPAGATAYVGSPKSDMRLRIYDKGCESGVEEQGKLWRYEVQYRRQNALRASRALLDHRTDREPEGDQMAARRQVHAEVKKRGIAPRFDPRGYAEPINTARPPTDQEKWEKWVKMIGPAIIRRGGEYGKTGEELAAMMAGYDSPPNLGDDDG